MRATDTKIESNSKHLLGDSSKTEIKEYLLDLLQLAFRQPRIAGGYGSNKFSDPFITVTQSHANVI